MNNFDINRRTEKLKLVEMDTPTLEYNGVHIEYKFYIKENQLT